MGRSNRFPGLKLKGKVWWLDIDNQRYGRIYESTQCPEENRQLAEACYTTRTAEALQQKVLGIRPRRRFSEAAAKHLEEVKGKKCEEHDQWGINWATPHIGKLYLDQISDESLKPMRVAMKLKELKDKTVNEAVGIVRKILIKAARKWRHKETGQTWLEVPPLLETPEPQDSRPPYPLSWEEERLLLIPELPPHLADPLQYMANAGPRSVIDCCSMRWDWERRLPELEGGTLFVLPTSKNGEERVMVHNKIAQAIIERQRGKHPEYVWTYEGNPLADLNTTAWVNARARAAKRYQEVLGRACPMGFRTLHVHDWRHTFGRRLRAAGVSKETRAALLGHKTGDITTHYSKAELLELLAAVRAIETPLGSVPTLSIIRAQAA